MGLESWEGVAEGGFWEGLRGIGCGRFGRGGLQSELWGMLHFLTLSLLNCVLQDYKNDITETEDFTLLCFLVDTDTVTTVQEFLDFVTGTNLIIFPSI